MERKMYLVGTSNELLEEMLDEGKEIVGLVEDNEEEHEISFTFKDRIVFTYSEKETEDGKTTYADGDIYYVFSNEEPDRIAG